MIYFQTEFDVVVVVRQLIRRTDCEPVSHSTQWLLEGFNFRRNGGRAGFVVVIATQRERHNRPNNAQKKGSPDASYPVFCLDTYSLAS